MKIRHILQPWWRGQICAALSQVSTVCLYTHLGAHASELPLYRALQHAALHHVRRVGDVERPRAIRRLHVAQRQTSSVEVVRMAH